MIDHLDNLLRHLLLTNIATLTSEAQIRFRPPDGDWRVEVSNLNQMALNLYLVDLRENRKLRANTRLPDAVVNGSVEIKVAPARLDCHYLITAWSPAQPGPAVEPTVDEHLLLYQATAVLMNNLPLNPSHIYAPGSPPLLATPDLIREADLPTQILPAEGFPKLSEFWGATGANHRWKPAIYLVVTLPVALQREVAGPMVTTLITEYRQAGQPQTAAIRIEIGGHVRDNSVNPAVPVPDAWVRLERIDGTPLQTTHTNDQGRFAFGELTPGPYRLQWRAEGFAPPPAPRVIEIPSPTGEYDLLLN